MKKICCVTGTRADYPRVKSVLKKLKDHQSFDLSLIVTGSHLLEEYGYSYKEIISDGFEINQKVEMFLGDFNTPLGMAESSARCTSGVAKSLSKIMPDIVLLTVDRVETLAAITAASLMNFPVAHIQGGEITGTIDEILRHAITKMSHIHFPATIDAKKRILNMGENPDFVFQTGCPYIDLLHDYEYKNKQEFSRIYNLNPNKDWVIFTQHAVTTEYGYSSEQVSKTIKSLSDFCNLEIICLFSNTDAGGKEIIKEKLKQKHFKIIPNMLSQDFANLMKLSKFMIGNSSAGIREAPTFSLPAINIGTRQKGRLRSLNVIDVDYDLNQITNAIQKCLYDISFTNSLKKIKNPYGDGKSAKRIVDTLLNLDLNKNLIQKELNYDIKI